MATGWKEKEQHLLVQNPLDEAGPLVEERPLNTVGKDISPVTFSSAQNQYFSEQVCDEVFP